MLMSLEIQERKEACKSSWGPGSEPEYLYFWHIPLTKGSPRASSDSRGGKYNVCLHGRSCTDEPLRMWVKGGVKSQGYFLLSIYHGERKSGFLKGNQKVPLVLGGISSPLCPTHEWTVPRSELWVFCVVQTLLCLFPHLAHVERL